MANIPGAKVYVICHADQWKSFRVQTEKPRRPVLFVLSVSGLQTQSFSLESLTGDHIPFVREYNFILLHKKSRDCPHYQTAVMVLPTGLWCPRILSDNNLHDSTQS